MGKRYNLKTYTIHILAIRAIDVETFDLPTEQNAIIVCTYCDNLFIYAFKPENILIMDFPDVEDKKFRAHLIGRTLERLFALRKICLTT